MPSFSSGQMDFSYIQTYFGGTNPIGLEEYYRGGANVPDITQNSAIPASGQISAGNFYSKWGYKSFSTTLTVGSWAVDKYNNAYGYSVPNGAGSMGTTSWTCPNGTATITGFYVIGSFNYLIISGANSNDDSTFRYMVVNGVTFNRAVNAGYGSGMWNFTPPWPSSGSYTVTVHYIG